MIRFLQRLSRATQQGPDADIRTLVRREFGLRVGQRSVYEEALTHSSMLDGDKSGLKSNERLEFLGDVVLDMTMANYLYKACLLYTSTSPRDAHESRMPSSA